MRTVGKSESVLQLKINIPARCLVASYELRVLGKSKKVLYTHKKPMYVLFNPWSPGMSLFCFLNISNICAIVFQILIEWCFKRFKIIKPLCHEKKSFRS